MTDNNNSKTVQVPGRIFAETAPEYKDPGHPVIPIKPGDKRPSVTGWSAYSDQSPSEALYQEWFRKKGDHGVGIVTGAEMAPGKRLVALDCSPSSPIGQIGLIA